MNRYKVTGKVRRFPGKGGWFYVELDKEMSNDFRPLIKEPWPALLSASFKLNNTKWDSSIMPIKDGPLFIALPAKVRKAEGIQQNQIVSVEFQLK